MSKPRTEIPLPTRRQIFMEAGYKCPIPRCGVEAPSLEIHHIDDDPTNHTPSNLIALCRNHHGMVTRGQIDRPAVKLYKLLLSDGFEYGGSEKFKLITRVEFHKESGKSLEKYEIPYRTTFVGPLFLHPQWAYDLGRQKGSGIGYDERLCNFLINVDIEHSSDIRIICRNSPRYLSKIQQILHPSDMDRFKEGMLEQIEIIWGEKRDCWPQICCVDTGILQIPTIHSTSAFLSWRSREDRPILESLKSNDQGFVRQQIRVFDLIFEANFRGLEVELETLRTYILSL